MSGVIPRWRLPVHYHVASRRPPPRRPGPVAVHPPRAATADTL